MKSKKTLYSLVFMMLAGLLLWHMPFLTATASAQDYLVQSGEYHMPIGEGSHTIPLTTTVDKAHSFFLLFSSNDVNGNTNPSRFLVNGELAAAGTGLVLTRYATGTGAWVSYSVIQHPSISVQDNEYTLAIGVGSADIPITSVGADTSKSMVILHRRCNATRAQHNETMVTGYLTSTTNLRLQRVATGTAPECRVRWQVVTFTDASTVQTNEKAFLNGQLQITDTLSPSVDPTRSWLYFTSRINGVSSMSQEMVRGLVTAGDTVTFQRVASSATNPTVRWFVVEFPGDTDAEVQTSTVDTALTTDLLLTDTLTSSIDKTQTFLYHTTRGYGGGTAYPRPYWINRFWSCAGDTCSQVQFERWYNGQQGGIAWQAVKMPTNNTPTLDWTGNAGFVNDGVEPNSGLGGTTFRFEVKYRDADNEAPAVQQVWIDLNDNSSYEAGEKFNMSSMGGTDYVTGVDYEYETQVYYAGDGTLNYKFYFSDGTSYAVPDPGCTGDPTSDNPFTVTNNAPILYWTGETNFVSDGVHPDSGSNGQTFEFRVKYTDADNNAPGVKQVWIDLDGDGYEPGEKFNMSSMGGSDYRTGVNYTYSAPIFGDGILNYTFFFDDGTDNATGTPTSDHTFTVTNTAPILYWTGETNFVSDGVHPDSGSNGQTFEFRVKYTDADNNEPSVKQVWIDLNDNSTYEPGEKFNMTSMGGSDYIGGVNYTYSAPIYADGTLDYRFYFTDGTANATGTPTSDHTFTVTNTAPILYWTGQTNFESDGVHPDTGSNGETFEFRVKYTDADNNPPTVKQVWIDLDDSDTYEPGEKFDMTSMGGSDYIGGVNYTYSKQIFAVATLKYTFFFNDGLTDATGTPTSDHTFTVTNNTPTLTWTGNTGFELDGVDPNTAASGSLFEFQVKYTDLDNNPPVTKEVWIDLNDNGTYEGGEKFDMTSMGGSDYTAGVNYNYSTNITSAGDGNLSYAFYFSDGTDPATGTPTSDHYFNVAAGFAYVCASGSNTSPYDTWVKAAHSIQDAINVATPGYVVLVCAGTYNETVVMVTGVSVISEGDDTLTTYTVGDFSTPVLERATLTIINGSGSVAPVVTFLDTITEAAKLDGFTVQNVDSGVVDYPLIGISGGEDNSQVTNCIITDNQGTGSSGGIGLEGVWWTTPNVLASPLIHNNRIHNVSGPGIGNGPYSSAIITNNVIWDCKGTDAPGIGLDGDPFPTITGNEIFECRAGIGSRGPSDEGLLEAMGGVLNISTIQSNKIHDNTMGGIRLKRKPDDTGTVNITIGASGSPNEIYLNGRAGIRLDGATATATDLTNATIKYNLIYSNAAGSGIDLNYVSDAQITANDIYSNGWAGISMWDGVDGVSIELNTIHDNGSAGVNISYDTSAAQTVQISNNNEIYDNGMAGVRNDSATSLTVSGNSIYSNGRSGIRTDAGSGTISNNDIYQNSFGGIAIRDACDGCTLTISRNSIRDNVRGGIHTGSDVAGGGFLGTPGNFDLIIRQNKVYGNGQSGYGAGIDVRHAAGQILNNLVYENHRAGIRYGDWIDAIINNTVAEDGESSRGGGIVFDDLAGAVNDYPDGAMTGFPLIRNNISAFNEMAGLRVGGNSEGASAPCPDNVGLNRDYNLLYSNHPWNEILNGGAGGWNDPDCGWYQSGGLSYFSIVSCGNQQYGGCGLDYDPWPPDPFILWPMLHPHDMMDDPEFVNKDEDVYQLLGTSPAIDAGDPDPAYNDPGGSRNDMGAYGGPNPLDW